MSYMKKLIDGIVTTRLTVKSQGSKGRGGENDWLLNASPDDRYFGFENVYSSLLILSMGIHAT